MKPSSHTGVVKLMADNNTVIIQEQYTSIRNRNLVLEKWRQRYSHKDVLTIQICPDDSEPYFKETKKHKPKEYPQQEKRPWMRPPAIYDNTGRSLYP